jgi:hypothetical protein
VLAGGDLPELIEREKETKKWTKAFLGKRDRKAGILFGQAKWLRKDMSVSKRSRRESGGNDAG